MSGNTIKLILQSVADASGFKVISGAVRRLIGSVSKIGGAVRGAFSRLGGFAAGIGRNLMNIKAGFEMAAGAVRVVLSNMGKAFKFETQTIQFKTLIGSIDEAKAHMKMLQELGDTPPFSLDQFAAASRSLMVMSDGALGYRNSLEMIGDAAAATGQPIETLAHEVGRAYAIIRDGQPITRATMSLRNMGVITPEVAAKMDKMQTSGADNVKIWNELQAALRRYSGAMKETEQTGEGLIGAISSQWDNTVRDFGAAFMDVVKGGLSRVLDKMRELREDGSIELWAKKAAAALQTIRESASTCWNALKWVYEKSGASDIVAMGKGAIQSATYGVTRLAAGMVNGESFKDAISTAGKEALDVLKKNVVQGHWIGKLADNGYLGDGMKKALEDNKADAEHAAKMDAEIRKKSIEERKKAAEESAKVEANARLKENTRIAKQLATAQAKADVEARRKFDEELRKARLEKDKAANTERANDLKDKLKKAQDDVATAAAQFANPKLIDLKAERRAARLADINRVRLANAAIDLQARNPNWRFARNLNRRDEAARRWLLAKENEQKAKKEQKQVVDKLAKIEKLLEKATTL